MNGSELIDIALNAIVPAYTGKRDRVGRPLVMKLLEVADYFNADPIMFTMALVSSLRADLGNKAADEILAKFGEYSKEIGLMVEGLHRAPGASYSDWATSVIATDDPRYMAVLGAIMKVDARWAEVEDDKETKDAILKAVERLKKAVIAGMLKALVDEEGTTVELHAGPMPKEPEAGPSRTLH